MSFISVISNYYCLLYTSYIVIFLFIYIRWYSNFPCPIFHCSLSLTDPHIFLIQLISPHLLHNLPHTSSSSLFPLSHWHLLIILASFTSLIFPPAPHTPASRSAEAWISVRCVAEVLEGWKTLSFPLPPTSYRWPLSLLICLDYTSRMVGWPLPPPPWLWARIKPNGDTASWWWWWWCVCVCVCWVCWVCWVCVCMLDWGYGRGKVLRLEGR